MEGGRRERKRGGGMEGEREKERVQMANKTKRITAEN